MKSVTRVWFVTEVLRVLCMLQQFKLSPIFQATTRATLGAHQRCSHRNVLIFKIKLVDIYQQLGHISFPYSLRMRQSQAVSLQTVCICFTSPCLLHACCASISTYNVLSRKLLVLAVLHVLSVVFERKNNRFLVSFCFYLCQLLFPSHGLVSLYATRHIFHFLHD